MVIWIDIKRAYFYAAATRPIHIEIPSEDREPGDEDRVGLLNLSLYGTRDAAVNWTREYTSKLITWGFHKGRASPCNFLHTGRNISLTVHGDDFTATGTEVDLLWLKSRVQSVYEMKSEILGPLGRHKKEIRVLNRVICWTHAGISYEPDQRHAEMIISAMEVTRSVSSPGCKDEARRASAPRIKKRKQAVVKVQDAVNEMDNKGIGYQEVEEIPIQEEEVDSIPAYLRGEGGKSNSSSSAAARQCEEGGGDTSQEESMNTEDATLYRGIAARANFLAQDRCDIQYSVKECTRRMATPMKGDWALLKRLARYLLHAPRAVQYFAWQEPQAELDVFADSDWAGCRATSRSTSGGAACIGQRLVKSWSSTQAVVALSSGEAELYSIIKGSTQAIGLLQTAMDLGMQLHARVRSDSTAALGILQREGIGKLRHVRVQYLWLQGQSVGGQWQSARLQGSRTPPTS